MPTLRVAEGDGGVEVERAERFIYEAARALTGTAFAIGTGFCNYLGEVCFRFNFQLPPHPQVSEALCPYCHGMGCFSCEDSGTSLRWDPVTEELLEEVRGELLCMLVMLTHPDER